jgi:hypothetical protein
MATVLAGFTTAPPAAMRSGSSACVTSVVPTTLTSNNVRTAAVSASVSGPARKAPAELTTKSTLPNAAASGPRQPKPVPYIGHVHGRADRRGLGLHQARPVGVAVPAGDSGVLGQQVLGRGPAQARATTCDHAGQAVHA